jgi:hypothetical protein
VDYDGRDLEILAIDRSHDRRKELMGRFVERVAEECEIPYRTGGSTTRKRPEDHEAPESQFLPVTAEEIRRWVVDEDSRDESAWSRRLRVWARGELLPRPGR